MNGVANGLYGGDLPNQINTPWIDFSEQSTIVGWSSFTAKQIRYKVVGNIVYIVVEIVGVSNSTATSFTLPYTPKMINSYAPIAQCSDNGTSTLTGLFVSVPLSVVTTCWRPSSISNITPTSSWTASGNKLIRGQFFYEI